jgi:hypothetical protein
MSNTTTKVLAGCGVGCLLITVALVGLGWMGYRWARTAAEVVEAAERAEARLEEEYGLARDFTPSLDGRVAADRIEAFLSVREAMTVPRESLAEAIEALAPANGEGRTVGGIRAARAGMSMAPRALEFVRARNEALLAAGMGPGEYAWLYWLTYHAWLGHPPGDSLLQDIMEARSESQGSVHMHFEGMDTEQATWQLRRDLEAMLRNLDNGLAESTESVELSELVSAELAAMEADHDRFPWQDGLPDLLATGLETHRDRLEASYSPATNPFELLELD